ncbi:phosphoethanolamine transferase [Aurantimonas coralicida]|uniref:phosphoethanolamine transferase n=1 Tax=Aurantimonas coralicida TaxID=182270 RepID=UPI00238D7FA5|nr:phosphoethanolamine--lipid A transferase [Aurantimonas coralicida]MDE0923796.1 phosphoethanolamine--lipid A transferase [Aurantimonas coralicida]
MKRPCLTSIQLSLLVTIFVLATANQAFWIKGWTYFDGHPFAFAAFGVAIVLLGASLLTMFSMKYVIKPVFILFVLVAAISSYFVDSFGIVVDRDMIQNAVATTPAEAGALITPDFLLHVVLFGVLPALAICLVRVRHRTVLAKAGWNTAFIAPALLVVLAVVFANFSTFAATFRNHRDLMASLNPAGAIIGFGKVVDRHFADRNLVVAALGEDARRAPANAGERPRLLVVVAGETARAQNFSLLGYDRETNPQLAQRDVVAFSNVQSCGTMTAVSLPCMFSVYGRSDYSDSKGKSTENLLDVLDHAGVATSWFDNNTGSKGIADRLAHEYLPEAGDPRYCEGGECRDDVLVDRLKIAIADLKTDSVIVLHQIGSHGPAYYKRYDETARRFVPDCRTPQLADCTAEELTNAYDNTIVQTDRNLAQIIDVLASHEDRIDTAMIYISDHGESLGESGLYLHAAPYFMAPVEQTHVPMIAWFSEGFSHDATLDRTCLVEESGDALSHDNLFHTVLGLMDVETAVYEPALDLTTPCRDPDVGNTGNDTEEPRA